MHNVKEAMMSQANNHIDFEKLEPFFKIFTRVLGVNDAIKLHRSLSAGEPGSQVRLRETLRKAKEIGVST